MEDRVEEIKQIVKDAQGLLQVHWEWERFLTLLDEIKPKTYLELGIEYGGSIATVKKLLPDCRCIGIDLKHPLKADSNQWGGVNCQYFEFVMGDTHHIGTKDKLERMLEGKRADILLIDANHKFLDVVQDFYDYAPLAKVVALHDIVWSPYAEWGGFYVHFFWEYLKTQYRSEEILVPMPEMLV